MFYKIVEIVFLVSFALAISGMGVLAWTYVIKEWFGKDA